MLHAGVEVGGGAKGCERCYAGRGQAALERGDGVHSIVVHGSARLAAINARGRNPRRLGSPLSRKPRGPTVPAAPNILSPHPKSPPTDLRHQRSDPASWPTSAESLLGTAWAVDPDTALRLVANLRCFGYLKDLPELLHRIVHGGVSTRTPGKKARLTTKCSRRRGLVCFGNRTRRSHAEWDTRVGSTEQRVTASLERDQGLAAAAVVACRTRRAEAATRAVEMYTFENKSLTLVASKVREFSLAAKWFPSLDSSYDHSTLIYEAVARRLFPKGSAPELTADLTDEHYAYRARERLLRVALVPLRRTLKLPEVFISARAWESVWYTRVAFVAMKNYTDLFLKHDAGGEVADLQWQRMVDDMRALGKLSNCVTVCDVSGSMYGRPMEVCVALGLLVSKLSDNPWRGHVVTFSRLPELHRIAGETLSEKTRFIQSMALDTNADFQAVFNKILEVAVGARLAPERMGSRVKDNSEQGQGNANDSNEAPPYKNKIDKLTGYRHMMEDVLSLLPHVKKDNQDKVESKQSKGNTPTSCLSSGAAPAAFLQGIE
eukprot:XP_020400234.1 uncharacterized protein LOC103640068 [Zea mays]